MAEGADETVWIVPPPAPGGVNIHITVHPDAELSPEFQEALDQLMQALSAEESVQGYRKPQCGSHCDTIAHEPCFTFVMCRIGDPSPGTPKSRR